VFGSVVKGTGRVTNSANSAGDGHHLRITKRCRLSWLTIAPSYKSPMRGEGGGGGGLGGLSQAEYPKYTLEI
jgi:hypothetical protein